MTRTSLNVKIDVRGGRVEKIEKIVNFNKGGNGGHTARVILKNDWIKDMGLSKEENKISMEYDPIEKSIIIKKLTK